jgi:hypothetical protein
MGNSRENPVSFRYLFASRGWHSKRCVDGFVETVYDERSVELSWIYDENTLVLAGMLQCMLAFNEVPVSSELPAISTYWVAPQGCLS